MKSQDSDEICCFACNALFFIGILYRLMRIEFICVFSVMIKLNAAVMYDAKKRHRSYTVFPCRELVRMTWRVKIQYGYDAIQVRYIRICIALKRSTEIACRWRLELPFSISKRLLRNRNYEISVVFLTFLLENGFFLLYCEFIWISKDGGYSHCLYDSGKVKSMMKACIQRIVAC